MKPWVECEHLTIDLDRPANQRFDFLDQAILSRAHALFAAVLEPIPAKLRLLADAVRLRTRGRFHDEAAALAKLVGHDWRSVMIANITYDLAMTELGCSTMALATPQGPVLARNMDWRLTEQIARCSYHMSWLREGKASYITAGFPGAVGVVTGMSTHGGFAVALNAIKGFRGLSKTGYPVMLHMRRVLEDAHSFDQAVDMFSKQRLAAPAMFTVVGRQNHQRVVIERGKRQFAHRWASDGRAVLTTNHFHLLPRPVNRNPSELFRTSFTRYDALCRFTADMNEQSQIDDATILKMLSDSSVIQPITAQHIITRPAQDQMKVYIPGQLAEPAPSRVA